MADTSAHDLSVLLNVIRNVAESGIVAVNMPLRHYLQECLAECIRIENAQAELEPGGMDFAKVSMVHQLVGACRQLLSEFSMIIFPDKKTAELWAAKKEEAEYILWDLKTAMDYAFSGYKDLLAKVSMIREGASNADFVQDLNDSSVLAIENKELLEGAKYDMANAQLAAVLSKELAELLAQATVDKSSTPELSLDRAKGFTLLKTSIDELISQARYILRADRFKAAQFMINPPRKKPPKKKVESVESAVA